MQYKAKRNILVGGRPVRIGEEVTMSSREAEHLVAIGRLEKVERERADKEASAKAAEKADTTTRRATRSASKSDDE